MKIYKYKRVSQASETDYARLERIVQYRAVWCARPDSLNDPQEFAWTCDFTPSPDTVDLLTDHLVRLKGGRREDARRRVLNKIGVGGLKVIAEPIIANMIRQSREEIGVACFGTSPENDTLWKRYAGDGAGVCVELDVPDHLLGTQLHRVTYVNERVIHVDHLLRGVCDRDHAAIVYSSLLSKTTCWEPEDEIRFLSKQPDLEVPMEGEVTRVILGATLDSRAAGRVREIAGRIPVVERGAVPFLVSRNRKDDAQAASV